MKNVLCNDSNRNNDHRNVSRFAQRNAEGLRTISIGRRYVHVAGKAMVLLLVKMFFGSAAVRVVTMENAVRRRFHLHPAKGEEKEENKNGCDFAAQHGTKVAENFCSCCTVHPFIMPLIVPCIRWKTDFFHRSANQSPAGFRNFRAMITSRKLLLGLFAALPAALIYTACRHDDPVIDLPGSGFPKDVGHIILTKCATSGCHNEQSKDAAAGLSLATWEAMMKGDRNGAVTIPYAHDFSTTFLFSNTYSDMGATVAPSMPYNLPPLSREEVTTLRDWIDRGAPNAQGFVKFSDNPNRQKYYLTNQGCDVVTVFDAATKLPMRYINVGHMAQIESPHCVRVSPDGQYWYVSFIASDVIQKYRTSDDSYVGECNISLGSWNTFAISDDSHYAFVVDWISSGKIAYVDLNTMSLVQMYQGSNLFEYPHGSFIHGTNLYVTAQNGNFIYKIDVSSPTFPSVDKICLQDTSAGHLHSSFNTNPFGLNPHEIMFSPDGSKYFVTCQHSNEVRVMETSTDRCLDSIPVGSYPVEMSVSTNSSTPYLFVTCMEDTVTFPVPGKRGTVAVINYNTNTLITSINTGMQPHGVVVDDDRGIVLVSNRNISSTGPAPHHSTSCGGRNGYMAAIRINTLTLDPEFRQEVSVDPYSLVYRR